ncbi:MAG: hypothetical protein NVS3B20_13980 [Polyangiales bacterium]
MRNLSFLVIVAGELFLAKEASADGPRTSSLSWVRLDGAEGCIAGTALARAIEVRLGRKVFVSAADADITVEGAIGPISPAGYRATLRMTARDGHVLGTRDVETRSAQCEAIDAKLALVVSVLIDPDATQSQETAGGRQAVESPPPRVFERIVVVHDHPVPSEAPPPWRFEFAVGLMATLGLQPNIGFALSPSVVVQPPGVWAILASGGVSARTTVHAERDAIVEASLAHGVLALCPLTIDRGRVHALGCAGGIFGGLRGRGVRFDTVTTSTSIVSGPLLTGRLSFQIGGPLAATVGGSLIVPIARAELGYQTNGLSTSTEATAFRTSAVAFAAEVSVGVRLP